MKKITTLTLMLAATGLTAYGFEPADTSQVVVDTTNVTHIILPLGEPVLGYYEENDTVQVVDFNLQEQELTLRIGESYQLHIDPADTKVTWWGGTLDFSANPVSFVDENGMVTAFRAGNSYAAAESSGGTVRKGCQVIVLDEGTIRKEHLRLDPTDECEWTDVRFSLDNEGNFTANGAFFGSGAQTSYLNYIVTDQCIFMWFDINYEDSTKMFYSQPFSLEINDCNANEYNVYFNNKTQTLKSQERFVKYSLRRGSSIDGTTNAESIIFRREDTLIYDLKGYELKTIPDKGIYIKDGRKYINY